MKILVAAACLGLSSAIAQADQTFTFCESSHPYGIGMKDYWSISECFSPASVSENFCSKEWPRALGIDRTEYRGHGEAAPVQSNTNFNSKQECENAFSKELAANTFGLRETSKTSSVLTHTFSWSIW